MFRVPYRWLPRTIWPNLRGCAYDLGYGILNLWRWLPVIWFDRDWDWAYLVVLVERQLCFMVRTAAMYWSHENAEDCVAQMKRCVILLRRIKEEEYFLHTFSRNEAVALEQEDLAELGSILKEHMTSWWD